MLRLHPKQLLSNMFGAAIGAAQPALCVPKHLPDPPKGQLFVIGAGKAAAAMAKAVEKSWSGPLSGLVVTRYGHWLPCERIRVVEAAHPYPDAAGMAAAENTFALLRNVRSDDLVLCLLSGGGSALWALPGHGITLEEKLSVTKRLLSSGASISEINCVRRHLSSIKGGKLAAACYPARVHSLMISDVPGDDPIDIASGPTVGDPTTRSDALELLRRYSISPPTSIERALLNGHSESIKPNDSRLTRSTFELIATPQRALEAAAAVGRKAGLPVHILGNAIEGEAREVGKVLAAVALQVVRHGQPFEPPCILLSGGETTVKLTGRGRGGRNVEFLLSLGIALAGSHKVHALAGDTDGIDGQEEIAGAYIGPDSLARASEIGVVPKTHLANNDAHSFFESLDDRIRTGPTLTNVNDFRAILVSD